MKKCQPVLLNQAGTYWLFMKEVVADEAEGHTK